MHLLIFILLAVVAAAAPTTFRRAQSNCTFLIEDKPWSIRNFVLFQVTKPHSDCQSYLTFNFIDVNKGLRTNTTCERHMPFGSNATLESSEWYRCKNPDAMFMWEGDTLQMSHWYEDDCLGDPPYNSAIAYGRVKTNLTRTKVKGGDFATQTRMQIPITSLS